MTKNDLRIKIHRKFDGHCGYCGRVIKFKQMQVDHMHPKCFTPLKSLFGGVVTDLTDDISNLMPACRQCNHYKRGTGVEGFRHLMITLHTRIMKFYIVKVAVNFGMVKIKPFNGVFYFEKFNIKIATPKDVYDCDKIENLNDEPKP